MSINWFEFLHQAIAAVSDDLRVVCSASSCREGWLQGEIFLAGRELDIRVNEYSLGNGKKADLYCDSKPPMVGEIKIVGADYHSKMRHSIDADVDRIRRFCSEDWTRLMVLVTPQSDLNNKLSQYLSGCSFSDKCLDEDFDYFRLRIWEF